MSAAPSSPKIEVLLEHSSWVRALARRLATSDDAEDLEQSTWLAALSSHPRVGVPMREWLGTVVRNFARQSRRSRSRRAQRELDVARREATESTDDVLERAELQRRIATAVMELDEPYRTTVLLRYFEDLAPREIAGRMGAPVATVRTRLARAIERLRVRFDDEHGGDRAAWSLAFGELFDPSFGFAPSTLATVTLMNTKTLAAAAAVVVLSTAAWWMAHDDDVAATDSREPAPHTADIVDDRPNRASSAAVELRPSEGTRSVVSESETPSPRETPGATVPAERVVRGRVLDASGFCVGGVKLVARADDTSPAREIELLSNARGEFELGEAPQKGSISSGDRRFTTVMKASFGAQAQREPIVIIAARVALSGEVQDELGELLEGADVSIELPADLRSRFKEVLDSSATAQWNLETSTDGRFEFGDLPAIDGSKLSVRAPGFVETSIPAPQESVHGLRIVLTRPQATDGFVRGRVVDEIGLPVKDAYVAFGIDSVTTPDDGTFAFEIDDPKSMNARMSMPATMLQAVRAGRLPSRFEPPVSNGKPQWPAFVTLTLSGTPLSISGLVVDARGAPMQGVRVFATDTTMFGAVSGRPMMLESVLAGSSEVWSYVESDAAGRFELRGLLEREYVLRAHDPSTLLRVDSASVRAGSARVELVIPTDELYPRVAGRVLSHSGQPVAGANVFPMCDAFQARANGRIIGTSHDALDGVRTDDDGKFELKRVPKNLVYLRIEGENILPLEYGRYVEGDARFADSDIRELPRSDIETLEIRVEMRCHAQVELRDPLAADEFSFVDKSGRELTVSLFLGSGDRQESRRLSIPNGRSAVLGVPDNAGTLVLFKAGEEVGRIAVELSPNELTTITY